MARGVVKFFKEDKGYGFISREGESDVFVHHTAIKMEGYRTLNSDDEVEFDVENGPRGPIAQNVVRTKVASVIQHD